jgi:Flp pilus assembly protein TadG
MFKSNLKKSVFSPTRAWSGDTRGNTAVIFAIVILPLLMLGGMAIDFRRAANGKSTAQAAIDSAVLAGSRVFLENGTSTTAQRQAMAINAAQSAFTANLETAEAKLTPISVNFTFINDLTIRGLASVKTPTTFAAIVGQTEITSNVQADAQAGDVRGYEIVLVLDNTSSMFTDSRFEDMRLAAKQFVETMFVSSPEPENTRIGIVPVATLVNIKVEEPREWDEGTDAGISAPPPPPAAGSRTSPNAPFESREKYLLHHDTMAPLSKSDVDKLFEPVEWRGCIRAGANERAVSAAGTVTSPLTDDPVAGMSWPVALVKNESWDLYVDENPPAPVKPDGFGGDVPIGDKDDGDDGGSDTPTTPTTPPPAFVPPGMQGSLDHLMPRYGDLLDNIGIRQNARGSNFQGYTFYCDQAHWQSGHPGGNNVYVSKDTDCSTDPKQKKTGTRKACVSDPNEFDWISGGKDICPWETDILPWDTQKAITGPNLNCPTAMLGLSSSPAQIYEKLDHMYPVPGGTQMDVGMSWALRMLSPRAEWTEFFGYKSSNKPEPFTGTTTRKMVILLTDGASEAPYHFEGYYGCNEMTWRGGSAGQCWRHNSVNLLSNASVDNLLLDSCKALRDDYGVEVYTIALDLSNPTATGVLEQCAGGADKSFSVSASNLGETFDKLAKRTLRLTK